MKKTYKKPQVVVLGSVEEITGWIGGGCEEFLGGTPYPNSCHIRRKHYHGPADFGS